MIEIERDALIFRFADVHDDAEMAIQFRRTSRNVYAQGVETGSGARELALARNVAEMADRKGDPPPGPDGEVNPEIIIRVGPGQPSRA